MIIHIQTRNTEHNYNDQEVSMTITGGKIYLNHTGVRTFETINLKDVLVIDVRNKEHDFLKQYREFKEVKK